MRLKFAIILLSLGLTSCTTANVSTGYYDIKGSDSKTLDREIKAKGPLKGHALASAAIRFEPVALQDKLTDKGCSFSRAKIKVIAEVTLPRWNNRAGADRDLKRAFDNLSRYAKAHEDVHVKIANFAARKMEKNILAIPPQKTCERLNNKLDQVVKQDLKLHNQLQKAFDDAEEKRLKRLFGAAEKGNS